MLKAMAASILLLLVKAVMVMVATLGEATLVMPSVANRRSAVFKPAVEPAVPAGMPIVALAALAETLVNGGRITVTMGS